MNGAFVVPAASATESAQKLPESSRCQSTLSCRSVFDVALRAYQEGDYETALEGFLSGFENTEDPVLLVYLGRSLAKLGRYQAALDRYRQYQRAVSSPEPIPREEVQRDLAELEARLRPDMLAPCRSAGMTTAEGVQRKTNPLYRRSWFWGLAGAGTVGLALGLGLGLGLPNTPASHQTVMWNR